MLYDYRTASVTVARECDSNKGCVKVIRKMCWFLKRCESYAEGMLKELYIVDVIMLSGRSDSCQ